MLIPDAISRRSFLKHSFATATAAFVPAGQLVPEGQQNLGTRHGEIKPPRELPEIHVLCQNGKSATLQSITENHVTALQLMFTTCTTTCPMQGTIFERVQKLLPDMAHQNIQLISLSVDPKNDTPQAFTEWLGMFHAGSSWIGAAPALAELAPVKSFFGIGNNPLDPHSTQTSILNRSGRLVYRTGELPPPEQIASILRKI